MVWRRLLLPLAVLVPVLILSQPATPQPVGPTWDASPSADDMQRAFPRAALQSATSGRAVISCIISTNGALVQCRVVAETPAAQGFGAAALALADAGRFRLHLPAPGGLAPGHTMRVPINFRIPGDLLPHEEAATCYVLAAGEAADHPADARARNALVYWSSIHAAMLTREGAPPSRIDAAQITARRTVIEPPVARRYLRRCLTAARPNYPYGQRDEFAADTPPSRPLPAADDDEADTAPDVPVTSLGVCYRLAAAALEADPMNATARRTYLNWRTAYLYTLARTLPPDGVEAALADARTGDLGLSEADMRRNHQRCGRAFREAARADRRRRH